jgi:hypothetical protein
MREGHSRSVRYSVATNQDRKKNQRARTHVLSSVEGATSEDSITKPESDGNSRPVVCRMRDTSGHLKKPSSARRTHSLSSAEVLVNTAKKSQRDRDTHVLSSEEGGACQGSERKSVSEGYSRPVERRGRDSRDSNEASQRGLLTNCRAERHSSGRERKPTSEGHLRTVERRVRQSSGQRNKASAWGALTSCRERDSSEIAKRRP